LADSGYIRGQLGSFQGQQKTALETIFTYVLNNLRVGLPGNQKRAENLQWYQLDATTPASANEEFSIAHGLNAAPRLVVPVLDVTQTGNAFVPLAVTRPADAKRIYLESTFTNTPITIFVEAR
jgi:hypothetical protein